MINYDNIHKANSFIEHLMDKLELRDKCQVYFDVTRSDDWSNDSAVAYLNEDDDCLGFLYFTIEVKDTLLNTEGTMYRVLAHEMIHVLQKVRGDVFDYNLPYYEQSHEIEANCRQAGLANEYMKEIWG